MEDLVNKNLKIRYEILFFVYKTKHERKPLNKEIFYKHFGEYLKKEINHNLRFLDDKELFDCSKKWMVDGRPRSIGITSDGEELVEEMIKIESAKNYKTVLKSIEFVKSIAPWFIPLISKLPQIKDFL